MRVLVPDEQADRVVPVAQGYVDKYRARFEWVEEIALPPSKSRGFIHAIASQL
ncbi:hypothetical protein ACIA74_07080 [Streptomyces sp. NPDC051658]|uniref:hypothetical protein n=1 Tax=Streptomyces sp. NPDC051658 TaxID=3365667 RepID=UPI0037BC8D1E